MPLPILYFFLFACLSTFLLCLLLPNDLSMRLSFIYMCIRIYVYVYLSVMYFALSSFICVSVYSSYFFPSSSVFLVYMSVCV